jgi:predicted nucleic acid-binding protein
MPYLLDTDVLRYYLDNVDEAVSLVTKLNWDGVALTIITYIELYQGTLQTPDPTNTQERPAALLMTLPMLPLSPAVATRRAHL